MLRRPANSEFANFYAGYVSLVPDGDFLAQMEHSGKETAKLLWSIGEEKSLFRYEPGKWSVREVVGHIVDSERVFTYRALRFARGDATPLAGYDEKTWGVTSNAHERTLASHVADFEAVRAASLALFRGFGDAEFERSGTANNNPVTVRAIAWIVAGHERHHMKVLRERYLSR